MNFVDDEKVAEEALVEDFADMILKTVDDLQTECKSEEFLLRLINRLTIKASAKLSKQKIKRCYSIVMRGLNA